MGGYEHRVEKYQILEIYTDYLISSFSQTTATGLAEILGTVSHDKITRFLSENEFNSKDLWKLVKKVVRQIESEDSVLIIDDTIEEKVIKYLKEKEEKRLKKRI